MRDRLTGFVVPAYLLLCVLLGGSVQGIWRVMAIQLLAIALIAFAVLGAKREPLAGAARQLLLLMALVLLLFLLQLIPLPPDLWTQLPGRDLVARGYAELGYERPWLPVSMAPYETLATSLTLLPPIAVIAAMLGTQAYREKWIAGAVLATALLSVILGAVQSLGGMAPSGWWYLYEHTNSGAVGFFANSNHMGTLLLTAIPFAVALIAYGIARKGERGRTHGLIAAGAGGFLLVLVGLALNRSFAALALALPVIAFSAMLLPGNSRRRRLIFAAAAVLTVVAVALFTSSPIRSELAGTDTTSLQTRQWMWSLSWAAISDGFPLGTGLGTFEQLFRTYEAPGSVGSTFVNHAHNDYIELLFETGLAGMLLLAAFLCWWAIRVVRVWQSPLSTHYARAATIASGAILAHSSVDYPLRTAAISAIFAACLGLMAQRQARASDSPNAGSARHLKIG